ncbi:MAG: ImmA/IrrE family metallo-endopeptidase [Jatrophihabitantaceae bacterium]
MKASSVAVEMGWSGPRQTRLEQSEQVEISTGDLANLVRALRFPGQFFTTAPGSKVLPEDLLFRAPKATTLSEKDYLAQFSACVGDLLDTMDSIDRLPPVRLPRVASGTASQWVAAQVREVLGVELDQPIGYLMHELERAGVPVVVRSRGVGDTPLEWETNQSGPLAEKHLGYSSWTGSFGARPLVVLRAVDSWERTRWTVAHEIGHLVMHTGRTTGEAEEAEASRFASELLAPRDAIAAELPAHVTLFNLLDIKLKWGISISALVRHLFETGLITEQRYQMLGKQIYTRRNPATGRTWGRTEPGWDARRPERPRLLSKWAERCYRTAHPGMLTSMGLIWPQDLLEEMLALQRTAPASDGRQRPVVPAATGHASVIDFEFQRRSRRA